MWMCDTVAAFNMSKAICKLGLEGIVSKKVNAPYKSGPSKAWLKIKNPNAPAATRAIDGTF
jgi:ATP-dependent DNA ligase